MANLVTSFFVDVLPPVTIALATVYFSSKINERKQKIEDADEKRKQMNNLYFKINKLINALNKFKIFSTLTGNLRKRHTNIKLGNEDLPEEHKDMDKAEFLREFDREIRFKIDVDLARMKEEVCSAYDLLLTCPIDKLSPRDHFKCLEIFETGRDAYNLKNKLDLIESFKDEMQQKYK